MKIYLASRFDAQKRLREIRTKIHDETNHLIVSRWIDSSPDRPPFEDNEAWAAYSRRCAEIDLMDLDSADLAIFDMSIDLTGCKGGVYAEMGYCLGTFGQKYNSIDIKFETGEYQRIWIVGRRTNVFCYDYRIRHFNEWAGAYTALGIK